MGQTLLTAAQPLAPYLPARAWLPWSAVRKPDGKLDKPPALGAVTNRPDTWRTLDRALEELSSQSSVAGIGFAITAGIIALDFDDCRNPVTGELTDEAQRELERLNSYAYVTPSRNGFRVVGINSKAAPIPGGKRKMLLPGGTRLEVFIGPTNHYNTFTHEIISGYETVREIADETLDYLVGLPEVASDTKPNPDAQRGIPAIKAALKVIPNPARNWDQWSYVGMATWRASGGSDEGLDAFTAWSAKCDAHSGDACLERWRHWFISPPTKLGFGTLYHLARQANPLFVAPFDEVVGEPPRMPEAPRPSLDFNPETGEVAPEPLTATPFQASDLLGIQRRQWVYGHWVIRRFLAVLGAPGGTGKTAYALAVAASVALDKPLVGEEVHERGNVWYYNLEDPRDEMLRRIAALTQHHGIAPSALEGRLFLDSGRERPLVVAEATRDGTVITLPVVEELIAEITRRSVRLLIVDPFVKSHRLEENRNEQIDHAATLWGRVADKADCAVLLVHHFRKGGMSGDAAAFRGASALIDAARSAVSLATMSEQEADKMGVDASDRRFLVRMDNAKLNLAPPPEDTTWLKLQSVELPNGDALKGIPGDKVQAVERWQPPSPWDGVSMSMCVRILDKLGAGPGNGEQYTVSNKSADKSRWAGSVIMEIGCVTSGQAFNILRSWTENGIVKPDRYFSHATRKEVGGLTVDTARVAEMRQSDRGDAGE